MAWNAPVGASRPQAPRAAAYAADSKPKAKKARSANPRPAAARRPALEGANKKTPYHNPYAIDIYVNES
jgi:hypothetical protein